MAMHSSILAWRIPMDRGVWWATVHGVTKTQTQLSTVQLQVIILRVLLVLDLIAIELWCWGRLLRAPWTIRRSNQFILKEISPGCSLEGVMLKLKLQYFVHLI